MRRIFGTAAVLLSAMLTLSACGGGGSGSNPLDTTSAGAAPTGTAPAAGGGTAIVGSFNFPESVLLGSIYARRSRPRA